MVKIFVENRLTVREALPISARRRRWRFGGRCGLGFRDDFETRSSLLRGGDRLVSVVLGYWLWPGGLGGAIGWVLGLGLAGWFWAWAGTVLRGLGGGFPLPLLFDNWIGRKRDVGGGVLAGLGCRVGFSRVNGGPAWATGVRRDH
jgi:hypothetical protein